jgi:rhamnose utilization protein RhaD (predicted bifunctional aldolase and dehydrogenase)/NAD(P)-dependent dehydrogenase (short-subunit alcohol dehydrogenase family)
MEDRWDDDQAATHTGPIGECVYCTRLIGSDPALVLHGGGNSSVKTTWTDITGRSVEAIHVKGSGWDMGTIEAAGLTPLRVARLHELLELERLSDTDMMRELDMARLDPSAPSPSVESLLHALLPHPAVQHSHADVIINLTNLADGDSVVRSVFGDDVVVVPYVMPGFDLARAVRTRWPEQSHPGTIGMVLLNHGLFTFGDDSRQAYRRHVELIDRAERWLEREAPTASSGPSGGRPMAAVAPAELARLRHALSDAAGAPMVVRRHVGDAVARFVAREDLASVAGRGPLTPDHVIRTKRVPMVGRDVDGYVADYRRYVDEHRSRARGPISDLDPAPRIVLDPELGMLAIGRTAKDAAIAADIYEHTIPVIERAEDHLGGYRALPAADLFDVEYWELEQAKLRRAGAPPPFAGMVAFVTGAASGIGRACAAELLGRGAAVAGVDLTAEVDGLVPGPAWLGVTADVTEPDAMADAVSRAVERFGGVDVAVVSAGIFGPSRPIADLEADDWRQVMAVNVDAVADLLSRLHPLLALSPVGGRVVVVGSKNVPAPGMGASAYSASKAAVTQLSRVAALEWADDSIRVNVVHPDAVFDTGLWTPDLLAERAARYGLTVDEYKRRNLLHTEVTSAGVARVVAELCSDMFSATTGAQIPIDGGNDRVV